MTSKSSDCFPIIGILYATEFPDEPLEQFQCSVEAVGINLVTARRPYTAVYAGLESYLPAAVSIWITMQFFQPILKGAGEDAYKELKQAIQKLCAHFYGIGVKKVSVGKHKSVDASSPEIFAVEAESSFGPKFKLFLDTNSSDDKIERVPDLFFQFLSRHYEGQLPFDECEALENAPVIGGTIIISICAETGEINFPDTRP